MFNLQLTEQELKIYVNGLESSIKIVCQQICSNISSSSMLKQLMPTLQGIHDQLDKLQKLADEQQTMGTK